MPAWGTAGWSKLPDGALCFKAGRCVSWLLGTGGSGKGRQGTIPDQTLAETAVVAAERGVNQPDGNAKKQNPQNAKTKMLWRDGPKCWWCMCVVCARIGEICRGDVMPGWGLFVLSLVGGLYWRMGHRGPAVARHRPKFRVGWAGPFVPLRG